MAFHTDDRDDRPYLEIEIQGTRAKINALLDTGSSVSLLSAAEFRNMKMEHRLTPTNVRVTDAQDGNLSCIGTFEARIQGGDTLDVNQKMYVVQGLSANAILGMDFVRNTGLTLNGPDGTVEYRHPKGRGDDKEDPEETDDTFTTHCVHVEVQTVMEPYETKWVPMSLETHGHMRLMPNAEAVVTGNDGSPLMHPDCMVKLESHGTLHIPITNGLPTQVTLEKGQKMDMEATVAKKHEVMEIKTAVREMTSKQETEALSNTKREYLLTNLKIQDIPKEWQQSYIAVVLRNHEAFSQSKYDLGYCDKVNHTIYLEDDKPIFVPQFRLPREHEEAIEEAVEEWLRAGVVYRTRSRYNTPIFAVRKQGGGLRIVQDLRAINKKSSEDQYSIRDVRGTLDDLGQKKPRVFNTLDMSGAFHQCALGTSWPQQSMTYPSW